MAKDYLDQINKVVLSKTEVRKGKAKDVAVVSGKHLTPPIFRTFTDPIFDFFKGYEKRRINAFNLYKFKCIAELEQMYSGKLLE